MPEATLPANRSAHRPVLDLPWWRHGLVWMVIGGPVVVVVASIATFLIAARSPDPVVAHDSYRFRQPTAQAAGKGATEGTHKGMLPAQQGRNHAASPDTAR